MDHIMIANREVMFVLGRMCFPSLLVWLTKSISLSLSAVYIADLA